MPKPAALVCLAFVALILPCCGRTSNVITSVGDYPSKDGRFVASIRVSARTIITYEIKNTSGNVLAKGEAGNPHMKFFMCWDTDSNFWIDSEDTSRVLLCRGTTFDSQDITAESQPRLPKPPAEFVDAR